MIIPIQSREPLNLSFLNLFLMLLCGFGLLSLIAIVFIHLPPMARALSLRDYQIVLGSSVLGVGLGSLSSLILLLKLVCRVDNLVIRQEEVTESSTSYIINNLTLTKSPTLPKEVNEAIEVIDKYELHNKLPEELIGSISFSPLIAEPILADDGYIYNSNALKLNYNLYNQTSPISRNPLDPSKWVLLDNIAMAVLIKDFCTNNLSEKSKRFILNNLDIVNHEIPQIHPKKIILLFKEKFKEQFKSNEESSILNKNPSDSSLSLLPV